MYYKLEQFISMEEINGEKQLLSVYQGTPIIDDKEDDAQADTRLMYFVEIPHPVPMQVPPPINMIIVTIDNLAPLDATSLPDAFAEIKRKSVQGAEAVKEEINKPSNRLVLAQ